MGLLEVVFGEKQRARVGFVQFDASVSETHTKRNAVTSHPVEPGGNIADHIQPQPEELTINGVVSDHPIMLLASVQAESPILNDLTSVNDRADLAYAELRRIMDDGELVTVLTTLWEYENMAITSLTVPRSAAMGNAINATINLRQVITAQTETVELPEPDNKANKPVKKDGKQPKTVAKGPVGDRSLAIKILASGTPG